MALLMTLLMALLMALLLHAPRHALQAASSAQLCFLFDICMPLEGAERVCEHMCMCARV